MSRTKPHITPLPPEMIPPANGHAAPESLSADPGPLLFTIGINRATSMLTFTGNTASEHDLDLLREALGIALANVQKEMIAAAERRGASKATVPPKA